MNVSKLLSLPFVVALLFISVSIVHADGGKSTSCSERKVPGCVLTVVDGVEVRYNGMNPWADQGVTQYGTQYQCVELIQRYYAQTRDYPSYWMPYKAYQVYDDWGHFARQDAYPNGSKTPPERGDILVFNRTWANPYGHVAIVEGIEDGKIKFAQENVMDLGEDSLPIDANNLIQSNDFYGPVRGWIKDTSHPAIQPGPAATVVQQATVNLETAAWFQLQVDADGAFRLEVDGLSVLIGEGKQGTSWELVQPGVHTVKLYADPNSNSRFSYNERVTAQARIWDERHFVQGDQF